MVSGASPRALRSQLLRGARGHLEPLSPETVDLEVPRKIDAADKGETVASVFSFDMAERRCHL